MGNKIAASLIQRLRSSASGTLLVSKTSAFPPDFTKNIFGLGIAGVCFDGLKRAPGGTGVSVPCTILEKTNIAGVSATSNIGEYIIQFEPNVLTTPEINYSVTGSIGVNQTTSFPQSAANSFFIKRAGSGLGVTDPNKDRFFIQTYYSPLNNTTILSAGPAFASRVNLVIYKTQI